VILDATAGNRTMWKEKDHPDIIYIDMERELEVPPTLFCDNTKTPFLNDTFDTIFWDPPHMWGVYNRTFSKPNFAEQKKILPNKRSMDPYYGIDKYASQWQLKVHLRKAEEEFNRILKPEGILWLKWNECSIPLRNILLLLEKWDTIMRIKQSSTKNPMGKHNTYWVAMIHKKSGVVQSTLQF